MRRLGATLAVVAVSLLVTAPRASATLTDELACNFDWSSNACLRFDPTPRSLVFNARAGLDVLMPEQDARNIINCGLNVQAALMGEDHRADGEVIRPMFLVPGFPAAHAGGLSIEVQTIDVPWSQLDEDGGSTDEIFAKISYRDCRTRRIETFRTGVIRGYEFGGFS
jgi:hypothetical protein